MLLLTRMAAAEIIYTVSHPETYLHSGIGDADVVTDQNGRRWINLHSLTPENVFLFRYRSGRRCY